MRAREVGDAVARVVELQLLAVQPAIRLLDRAQLLGSEAAALQPLAVDAVRVRGMALMGSVNVQRLPAPGTPKKFLGTY